MNINEAQEGYIVVPDSSGYHIYKLIDMETGMELIALDGSCRYWFSGTATYPAIVNTARSTTPEEIVSLIEEWEKRNERMGINSGAKQG